MRYIYDLNLNELKDFVAQIGEKGFRAGQIFGALHSGVQVDRISNIPNTLKVKLHENFNCDLPAVVEEQKSKDGTKKYLLQYGDSACAECVFLTQDYGNTVCVSTQVGCRMGCVFCASGKNGLVRNLTAGEILAQVILVNKLNSPGGGCVTGNSTAGIGAAGKGAAVAAAAGKDITGGGSAAKCAHARRGITNIVLMGSGEPLDNFDEVMKFLELVTCADGINVCSPDGTRHLSCGLRISARNISLSTSGLVPQIKKFADMGGQVNLCISLHAPNDGLRRQIMPIAKKYGVRELIDSAKYFFEKTHRRVIFEYSLIAKNGVPFNCTPEIARELADLVRGFPAHINLINLNTVKIYPQRKRGDSPPELDKPSEFTPPDRATALKFMDTLIKSGVSCTMRKNRGGDIDGACGQLRLRYV